MRQANSTRRCACRRTPIFFWIGRFAVWRSSIRSTPFVTPSKTAGRTCSPSWTWSRCLVTSRPGWERPAYVFGLSDRRHTRSWSPLAMPAMIPLSPQRRQPSTRKTRSTPFNRRFSVRLMHESPCVPQNEGSHELRFGSGKPSPAKRDSQGDRYSRFHPFCRHRAGRAGGNLQRLHALGHTEAFRLECDADAVRERIPCSAPRAALCRLPCRVDRDRWRDPRARGSCHAGGGRRVAGHGVGHRDLHLSGSLARPYSMARLHAHPPGTRTGRSFGGRFHSAKVWVPLGE